MVVTQRDYHHTRGFAPYDKKRAGQKLLDGSLELKNMPARPVLPLRRIVQKEQRDICLGR